MLRRPDREILIALAPWLVPGCLLLQPLDEAVPNDDTTGGGEGGTPNVTAGTMNSSDGSVSVAGRGGGSAGLGGGSAGLGPMPGGEAGGGAPAGNAGAGAETGTGGSAPVGDPIWALWPMPNPVSTGLPNPQRYTRTTPVTGQVLVHDEVTNLTWEQHDNSSFASRLVENAAAYCAGLTWAGRTNWRLPTAIELVSIIDFARNTPAIDPVAFPGTLPYPGYWTATPSFTTPGINWFIEFGLGSSTYDIIPGTGDDGMRYVRCVLDETTP